MNTSTAILNSVACCLVAGPGVMAGEIQQRIVDVPMAASQRTPYTIWPSRAPANCPFKASADIAGIGFTGRHAEYTEADTWFPTRASDGNLYSPWADATSRLPDDSARGLEVTCPHKQVTWITFAVQEIKPNVQNIGEAEMAVFGRQP